MTSYSPIWLLVGLTVFFLIVRVVVVTQLFPRNGGMRKTMEPQKPGNSSGPVPEVVERQRVAKERAVQRVRGWTVQNEMRGVLRRCRKDSANPREIRG